MKTVILTNTLFILFILPVSSWAQVLSVSGYINNSINGKAIENVSIFDSNSGIGTISNQNGFYRLLLSDGKVDLQISSEGFTEFKQHFELVSDTTLIVKLEPLELEKFDEKKGDEIHADANKKREKKKVTRRGVK